MSFDDGFSLPNIFKEGKTTDPPVRITKRKGRKGKKNRIGISVPNGKDSFSQMQKNSVGQAQGMGIDQPNKSLGVETFDQNLPRQPNPLEFEQHDRQEKNPFNAGIELDAGFKQPRVQPQQKRNPLNVGLQVGNLGIDTFDTKKSAFSGSTIDVGIGATPKARSALAGAANLGADFILRTRGAERTGLQGGGEQDFLRVSSKSFAGVPQILGSQEPTVAGARAKARADALARAGIVEQPKQLDALGGLQSLAGQLGRSASAVTLSDSKQARAKRKEVAGALRRGTGIKDRDFNPFNIRGRRRVAEREQEQIDQFTGEDDFEQFDQRSDQRRTQDNFERFTAEEERREKARSKRKREDFAEDIGGFDVEEETIAREIKKRKRLATTQAVSRDPQLEELDIGARATPQKDKRPKALPFDKQFDTDGDGDIENLQGSKARAVFGEAIRQPRPKERRQQQGFLSEQDLRSELEAKDQLSKIFVRKSRPDLTIGEINETTSTENLDLKEGETLETKVSDREFLDAGLNDQLPREFQKEFDRKMNRRRARENK